MQSEQDRELPKPYCLAKKGNETRLENKAKDYTFISGIQHKFLIGLLKTNDTGETVDV
jgi:hypothetical protein